MAKIASIEKVASIRAHPNADRLDLVKILGYQCVTQKGLYREGEAIVFIQPDSLLPESEWAEGYRKYSPKRIKAVKLRGEWSEGIIVPLSTLLNIVDPRPEGAQTYEVNYIPVIGADVAEELGVTHWEPPIPQDLNAKSSVLPFGMRKTDEERWENLQTLPFDEPINVTLKIDGQSGTFYYDLETDTFGVCSRGQELKLDCTNPFTHVAGKYDLENKLRDYGKRHGISLALRGEVYGQGIQRSEKNPHSSLPVDVAFFSVYLFRERRYATYGQEHYFVDVCLDLDLPIVPTMPQVFTAELLKHFSEDATEVDGKPFEGVVINHGPYVVAREIDIGEGKTKTILDPIPSGSFKIINKNYDSVKEG